MMTGITTFMYITFNKTYADQLIDEYESLINAEGAKLLLRGISEKQHDGFLLVRWFKPVPETFKRKLQNDNDIYDHIVLDQTFLLDPPRHVTTTQ